MKMYGLAAFALIAVLAGCSGDAPAPPEPQGKSAEMPPEVPVMGEERRVLALGDSLFTGYGLKESDSYPALLEAALRALALCLRPGQQSVGIEGVVHTPPAVRRKGKAHFSAPGADGLANLRLLGGGRSVFLAQVLSQILATRPHLGVEFKGLKVQVHRHFALQAFNGFFE